MCVVDNSLVGISSVSSLGSLSGILRLSSGLTQSSDGSDMFVTWNQISQKKKKKKKKTKNERMKIERIFSSGGMYHTMHFRLSNLGKRLKE